MKVALANTIVAAFIAAWAMASPACAEPVEPAASPADGEFSFNHEDVLGTSVQLLVEADSQAHAEQADKAALAEIQRLAAMLATRDASSQIAQLNETNKMMKCSPELIQVLAACERWRRATHGAFNAQLGQLITAWQEAAEANKLPNEQQLTAIVARVNQSALLVNAERGITRRTADVQLNVDALAKGFIADKALAAAMQQEGVRSALLNIGGDIATGGAKTWAVGVADPRKSQDNAAPLARLKLRRTAVATSGDYERYYTIDGRKYSHILDPRTGRPANQAHSATVVAESCEQADALATALSVLTPEEGIRLIEDMPGTECLLVADDGKQIASSGWAKLRLDQPASQPAPQMAASSTGWPADYAVEMTITIDKSMWRPPLAIWIRDTEGRHVATLAAWGKTRHLRKFKSWQTLAGPDEQPPQAVSRATRPGGTYRLAWDGKDAAGQPVPPGAYTVCVEITPDGKQTFEFSEPIECGPAPARARIDGNADSKLSKLLIDYGPLTSE